MSSEEIDSGDDLVELSEQDLKYIGCPYGGLFGNAIQVQIVEQIAADSYRDYRPKDFKDILGVSPNRIKNSLRCLTELKLLIDKTTDKYHPLYTVNHNSKQLMALTILSYAVLDDRDGTNLMDDTIEEYCKYKMSSREKAVQVGVTFLEVNKSSDSLRVESVHPEEYKMLRAVMA